ncbi:MAG: nickel pincer cofactor biosynthesis protein LarB [Phycisphaerae bacterium]
MDEKTLRELIGDIKAGVLKADDAVARLRGLAFEDLGFAKVDHHREIRCGFPEVVYCEGKSADQVVEIFERLAADGGNVLATRASEAQFEVVAARVNRAVYHAAARTITVRQRQAAPSVGTIAMVSAGTSDLPVAEEARVTAEIMDQHVETFYDVGVAGIHRLLAHGEALQRANVCVVVAGMEGALPSVVAGLVACPVIAVPTSVGYGASFGGVAALLAMLNSCASGVTVVNIDNGFAAGYTAALINRLGDRHGGT